MLLLRCRPLHGIFPTGTLPNNGKIVSSARQGRGTGEAMDTTTAAALRERHRTLRGQQSEALATRLHRAISWLQRGQMEGDDDTRFIHLWIALNAIYASEFDFEDSERNRAARFLARVVEADAWGQLHALLFRQFPGPIRTLIDNPYVFAPIWRALRDHDASERWKERFDTSRKAAMGALLEKRTADLLSIVLDRLYVLRNQLVHGGATWNSPVNRAQVRDGCAILGAMVPSVLDILLEAPGFDDDPIAFPVVPDGSARPART